MIALGETATDLHEAMYAVGFQDEVRMKRGLSSTQLWKLRAIRFASGCARAALSLAIMLVIAGLAYAAVETSKNAPVPPWSLQSWRHWWAADPNAAIIAAFTAVGNAASLGFGAFAVFWSTAAKEAESRHSERLSKTESELGRKIDLVDSNIRGLPDQIVEKFLSAIDARFAPQQAVGTRIHSSLPATPVRCMGRQLEVERVVDVVVNSVEPVAVSILGGPGMGKTTITRQVATEARVIERFGVRRYFIELESVQTLGDMRAVVAAALGSPESKPLWELFQELGPTPSLLVLDNLETVWEAYPKAIEDELARAANTPVSLLVSFRGTNPPAAPRWTLALVLEPLSAKWAQNLFLDIAPMVQASDDSFQPLLNALGGVPLAIELIARQAASFNNLNALWREWQRTGTALAKRRGAERNRTTSLDYSIELTLRSRQVSLEALQLLSAIAFLPGGIDEDAAIAICGDNYFISTRDLLEAGLAQQKGFRIDLLAPIREYVFKHLRVSEGLIEQLIDFYIRVGPRILDSPVDYKLNTIKEFIVNEAYNIPLIHFYAVHRRPTSAVVASARALYTIVDRAATYLDYGTEQQAAGIRIARGIATLFAYLFAQGVREKDYKKFAVYGLDQFRCELAIGKIMRSYYGTIISNIRSNVSKCPPEQQPEVNQILFEMEVIYNNRFGAGIEDIDLSDEQAGVDLIMSLSPSEIDRIAQTTFATDIPVDTAALRFVDTFALQPD